MDRTEKLLHLKEKITSIEKRKDRLKGRLDSNNKELSKIGYRNNKHARKELKKLKVLRDEYMRLLRKEEEKIEEYDDIN